VRALYNPGEIERLAKERNTVEAVRDRAMAGDFEPWTEGALKSGADRTQIQAEVAITTPAGVPKRLMLRAQYAKSAEGRPRLTGLLVDITETKMAEERIAVVARELQHRVKNSLSVIGTLAQQSLRGKTDIGAALKDFLGRLGALSAANDLILAKDSATADLRALVEIITRPYCDDSARFVIQGPPVRLPPKVATATGMILHELCTNAVKYGALSVAGGDVVIDWQTQDETLSLTWEERRGPKVVAPTSRGFGTRLLNNVVSTDLGGRLSLDYKPDGLRCQIDMPLDP